LTAKGASFRSPSLKGNGTMPPQRIPVSIILLRSLSIIANTLTTAKDLLFKEFPAFALGAALELGGLFFGPEDVAFFALAKSKGLVLRFAQGKGGKLFGVLFKGKNPATEQELKALIDEYQELRKSKGLAPKSGKLNAPNATDAVLQDAYRNLWRPEDARLGGTIGELLPEVEAGAPLKHLEKAKGRLKQLIDRVNDRANPLSKADRAGAERVINDLKDAIRIAEGK
jgi:hypothetical protein